MRKTPEQEQNYKKYATPQVFTSKYDAYLARPSCGGRSRLSKCTNTKIQEDKLLLAPGYYRFAENVRKQKYQKKNYALRVLTLWEPGTRYKRKAPLIEE